ncbi:hypothetical protein Z043_124074 [Scleropages formosus]|uniref:Ig-like domain-containing protein n=1 Tax=Scleropages formosus TaxID=113540 RepID=A0A0P7WAV5_SCLFO|nr:hypothetical protein Z043_124074 [Scleropages formosus]
MQVPGGTPQYILCFYHSHSSLSKQSGVKSQESQKQGIKYREWNAEFTKPHKEAFARYCNPPKMEKQVPGGVPQYVLRGCHGWSSPGYGTGFYSSRFTSNHQSKSDYRLIISSVSGVTMVTQKPPVLIVSKGEIATMECNLGTFSNDVARKYKQVPGEVPQFVLILKHEWSSPDYGTGFSSILFKSNHQSQSDYELIISVRGQRLVTQEPSVLNVNKGETAILDCKKPQDDSYNIYWYKQVPGGVPQFVLYFNRALSSPAYGTGFSSSHFTSRAQSNTHYQLVINSVEAEDSAVYYCKKWFGHPDEIVTQ